MDHFKPQPMPAFGKPAIGTASSPSGASYDPLLNGPATRAALGISVTTEWRWLNDPAIGYPPPDLVVNGRNYRRLSTINQFIANRAAKTKASPSRKA